MKEAIGPEGVDEQAGGEGGGHCANRGGNCGSLIEGEIAPGGEVGRLGVPGGGEELA